MSKKPEQKPADPGVDADQSNRPGSQPENRPPGSDLLSHMLTEEETRKLREDSRDAIREFRRIIRSRKQGGSSEKGDPQ